MSDAVVKDIIQKAVDDSTFRTQLFEDPDAALAGYDLTAQEITTLKSLNADNFDSFVGNLGDRGTKGAWRPVG